MITRPFLLFLAICASTQTMLARTIPMGNGHGSLLQNGMQGLQPGDILAIRAGSYEKASFSHLKDITIVNSGGLVTFSGTVYFGYNQSVRMMGKGIKKQPYGFRFAEVDNAYGCFQLDGYNADCRWERIEFLHCAADAFGNQNNITVYDGRQASGKRLLRCVITRIHQDGCGAFMTNYRGAFENVVDSCDFSYVRVDRPNTTMIINAGSIYRTNIHHWTIGQQICEGVNDVGCFQIAGSVNIYSCSETGANWGWFARIVQQSLNQRDDCYIYNNIRVGNKNYGLVDYRQETQDYQKQDPPFLRGGDMYVVNNTCGNMTTVNNYVTVVVAAYNFPGQHLYVINNLRFHSVNQNQTATAVNVVHYGTAADTITESNNLYVEHPLLSGVLKDTLQCYLSEGSAAIDAGLPLPFVRTDFGGISRPQGSRYDVGAREYISKNKPPLVLHIAKERRSQRD